MSFRLCSFPDSSEALNYIQSESTLVQSRQWGVFWTHDAKPVDSGGADIPSEAVVILRDTSRQDVVQLYSFVDMQAALAYLSASVARGLDLGSALLYWVTPVSLKVPASPAPNVSGPERPEAVTSTDSAHQLNDRPIHAERQGTNGKSPVDRKAPEGKSDEVVTGKRVGAFLPAHLLRQSWSWPGWDRLAPRIVGAAVLDREIYEDVRRDPQATGRAAAIVVAGAVSAGVGALGSGAAAGFVHVAADLAGWILCVAALRFVGVKVFGGREVYAGGVVQTVGLASAPALLLFLGAVPVLGPLFVLGTFIWMLVAMAVAVESSLELERESAILTVAGAWLLFFAIAQVVPIFLV
jgi:hypothetical protein